MTAHTNELPDERVAGFLHVRLRDRSTNAPFDLLLPDLPGEWSTALIDNNRVDRLEFLKSADSIWILVDGQKLTKLETRQLALHRTKLMVQRLATLLDRQAPPLVLVVSRRDLGAPNDSITQEVRDEATRHGMLMTVVHISSFSDQDEVKAGTGIAELIANSVGPRATEDPAFWPDRDIAGEPRTSLKFRNRRESRP
jgi:hypothetical protein